jgi:hypothetical protein
VKISSFAELGAFKGINTDLSDGSGTTQGSQTPLQRLVKRMTRFWVRTDIEATERELRDLFEMMNYGIKMTTPGILTAHTTDRCGP